MITLESTRTLYAPAWLAFEMVRNVEVHRAAVPDIQARVENGPRCGALGLHDEIEWSARYFGFRFRVSMKVTRCEMSSRYDEMCCAGPFRVFRHEYTIQDMGPQHTVLTDRLDIETGFGILGHFIDRFLLAPRFSRALEIRMDHLKQWSEDGTWRDWISDKNRNGSSEDEAV